MAAWQKGPDTRPRRLTGRKWYAARRQVLAEQKGECAHCGCMLVDGWALDHITPHSKGGSDDRENLQGLCLPCHDAKTAKDRGYRPRRRIGIDGYPIED